MSARRRVRWITGVRPSGTSKAPWRCYHTFDSLVLVRDGRLIFAELKSDAGQLRPSQQEWLKELAATAAEVHTWRPGDWDAIVEILRPRPGFMRGGVVRNRTAAESETPH